MIYRYINGKICILNQKDGNMDIRKISRNDSRYPDLLQLIDDPPEELWYEGDLSLLSGPCVAVVGSRKASEYGIRMAEAIGRSLGNGGVTVVSGMAYGVDIAAHQGALGTRGSTIAVLGSGIDMERSRYKGGIFSDIRSRGLVLSEYPPGYPASKHTFPRRNRIISGIAAAVCVVEAGIGSGSLITAELANEQGRCVYAVPGNIDSETSLGVNKLIRDGAVPVITVGDILEDMGIYIKEDKKLEREEIQILSVLKRSGETSIPEIVKKTGKSKEQVLSILSVLEMKGLIHTELGKVFFV